MDSARSCGRSERGVQRHMESSRPNFARQRSSVSGGECRILPRVQQQQQQPVLPVLPSLSHGGVWVFT